MPTYLGWNVITIPAYPPAPESIELTQVDPTSMIRSPFTGQQQIFSWGSTWMEGSVTMPQMKPADAQNWVAFLRLLQGQANVFQFSAAFVAAYPWMLEVGSPLASAYWRLKSPSRKWSLTHQRVFGFQFDIIQAL